MQNVAKFRLIEGLLVPQPQYVRIVAYMSPFFYLGPIRTNESQRAINKQKLPQMTFWGLFICKQTFSQHVAKFWLIEPSTYEGWHICPLFSFSAQNVRIGPIRTNESQRAMYKRCPK